MLRKLLFVITLAVIGSSAALVQPGHAQSVGAIFDHKVEVHGFGGYVWSSSAPIVLNATPGDIDLDSSPWWGIALDINLPVPGTQLELLYTRQDTDLTFKSALRKETLGKIASEYWHIGGVYTRFAKGDIYPFTSFTLGTTRYILKDSSADDTWKFSVTLGLGVKAYVSERIGIRAQARLPWTFLNTGAGLGIGTGGVSVGVGGSGIVGIDLSGGLFLML